MTRISGINSAAEVGVQNSSLGIRFLRICCLGGSSDRRIIVQSIRAAIPVEGSPVGCGCRQALVLIVRIQLVGLGYNIRKRGVDGGSRRLAVHEHVEALCGIFAIGISNNDMLYMYVFAVIVIRVGVKADFL